MHKDGGIDGYFVKSSMGKAVRGSPTTMYLMGTEFTSKETQINDRGSSISVYKIVWTSDRIQSNTDVNSLFHRRGQSPECQISWQIVFVEFLWVVSLVWPTPTVKI